MVAERRDNDKEVEEYHVHELEVQKMVRLLLLASCLSATHELPRWPNT